MFYSSEDVPKAFFLSLARNGVAVSLSALSSPTVWIVQSQHLLNLADENMTQNIANRGFVKSR